MTDAAFIALTALVVALMLAVAWLCVERDKLARRIAALEAQPAKPEGVRFRGAEKPAELGDLEHPRDVTDSHYAPHGYLPFWLPGEEGVGRSGTGLGFTFRGYL